jgi:hypothetical protein
MTVSRAGYEVFPDMKIDPANAIPVFEGQPTGGPQHSRPSRSPGSRAQRTRIVAAAIRPARAQFPGLHQEPPAAHLRRRAGAPHGGRLPPGEYLAAARPQDPLGCGKEEIVGDREASAMLVRPYRKPWDEVLRSFRL